jgi:hypothetical protein
MTKLYKIPILCDMGKTFESIGEMINSINASMSSFGFDEKIVIQGEICTISLTVNRKLTLEEKIKIQEIMQELYQEKLSGVNCNVRIANPEDWR